MGPKFLRPNLPHQHFPGAQFAAPGPQLAGARYAMAQFAGARYAEAQFSGAQFAAKNHEGPNLPRTRDRGGDPP